MAEERKHVQKSPLSHILSIPSATKKRTFSEKRIDKPDIKLESSSVPQSAPPSTVPVPTELQAADDTVSAPKADSTAEQPQNPKEDSNESPKQPIETDDAKQGEAETNVSESAEPASQATPADGEGTGAPESTPGSTENDGVPRDNKSETGANADGKEATAENKDEEQPDDTPRKRLKIDSSNVLESVGNFKRYISGVRVYTPGQLILDGFEEHFNSIVWVRIARRYLTRTNPGVERRTLWGTDVYTDDSDIVAALYHSGHLDTESENEKIRSLASGSSDLLVGVHILPRLLKYTGCYMNELNSRTWGSHHDGVSFRIDRVSELPRGSAEFPACETVDRAITWGTSYLLQKNVRESLRF